ncbi:hypothetical protein Y048_5988 [Burkholderia pseudomallei MSHR456]|nr:hypothetical protein Y048_5988 [Burkholderia pseudomallei MSHR456]
MPSYGDLPSFQWGQLVNSDRFDGRLLVGKSGRQFFTLEQ